MTWTRESQPPVRMTVKGCSMARRLKPRHSTFEPRRGTWERLSQEKLAL